MANLESFRAGGGVLGQLAACGGVFSVALFLTGCASTTLVPVGADARGVASARSENAELHARVRTSGPELPPELTPIEISIRSLGGTGVSVALEDIELIGATRRVHALSPEQIELRGALGLGLDPASPFVAPGAASSAAATPGAGRGAGGPIYEPTLTYAASGTDHPRERDLVEAAFLGGFIEPGSHREGLVYFRAPEGERLSLRVVVHAGSGSGPMEVLEIPFAVEAS